MHCPRGGRVALAAMNPFLATRPLWGPVYVPTVVYAMGSSILAPAGVLLALQVGASSAAVVGMTTWLGAFAIFASLLSGFVVGWWGENRAVGAISVLTAVALIGVAVIIGHFPSVGFWWLVAGLMVADLADAVWSIARQSLVADLAPTAHRGLSVNLYGAAQRLGRVAGPIIVALVAQVTALAAALGVAAGLMVLSAWLLVRARPKHLAIEGAPTADAGLTPNSGWVKPFILLGMGVLVLAGLRAVKDSLIPLWAADVVHLDPASVALVMSVVSVMELVLFLPAGLALDRVGRGPVVFTALFLIGLGLALLPLRIEWGWLVACACLVGLGNGAGSGIIKTLGVDLAPQHGRERFLGYWQTVASTGTFLGPATATAITAMAGLGLGLSVLGTTGMITAVWMAWWTPRVIKCAR